MRYWTDFGLRQMPSLSARRPADFPPAMQAMIEERTKPLREPFLGLTTEGVTAPVTDAAAAFAGALSAGQRQRAVFPLDPDERRQWLNAHPFVFRHGVMLEDLPPATRQLGLGLVQASLSARGFAQARDIMRLNGLLGEVTGRPDEYAESLYFLSFFGDPSEERPWAWQILGDQLVFTPAFMGSEPCPVFSGPLAGKMVFTAEERMGLGLIRYLDDQQAKR